MAQINNAKEPKYHGALANTMAVQTKLKQLILQDVWNGTAENQTKAKAKKIIDEFCGTLTDETYRERARAVLYRSFAKWYIEVASTYLALPFLLLSTYKNAPAKAVKQAIKGVEKLPQHLQGRIADLTPHAEYGREYHDHDYRKRLKAEYSRLATKLADIEAKYSKNVSLRNLAEVEIRRQDIADMISSFRARGITLAWASSHADCSVRCKPWQGKLYSLDGTYGTVDGHSYQPIENAINALDDYGNINGLFGYNCRHRLVAYVPRSQPPREYTEAQMQRERAIDQRQRAMERIIRKWKTRGFCLQGQDPKASEDAFAKAREYTKKYEEYSHGHGRAFYRERIQVMTEEFPIERQRYKEQS